MINLPNPEDFNFKDCIIAGDECWLITPKEIGVKWTEDTLKFRSMIVRKSDNFIVSRSFSKFFNYTEQPDLDKFPLDESFVAYEKLDGSLLICDKYKNDILLRTRGTTDARQMPNGYEIDFLINKYKKFFEFVEFVDSNSEFTFLCEWQTNSNVIVIGGFPEPKLSLIGIIKKDSGWMASQKYLDELAITLEIERPVKYSYNSIQECLEDVEMWVGREGVVLYSESGKMRKAKSSWYCSVHRLATGLRSTSHVLEFFLESPRYTNYQDFYNYTVDHIDFEVAEKIKNEAKLITDAYSKFVKGIEQIQEALVLIRNYDTRKEQAKAIQQEFPNWKMPIAFLLLDNREIDDKVVRKAMEKILEL
jgi:hypothetical protein